MAPDAAYAATRREGKQATVTTFSDAGYNFDEETGIETGGETVHTIRFMVKEPTKYKRIIRANAVEGNIGQTTFLMWVTDTKGKFTRLDGEDFITFEGERYDVVSFSIEDKTAVVVTANQVKRT
jgi:hypothetical protein